MKIKKSFIILALIFLTICFIQPISKATENVEAQTIKDGVYKIKSKVSSNSFIDISSGSKENGANVQIWENADVDQQKFQITYLESGYYKIEALHSKKVLDVQSAGKIKGTNVWQYEYNGTDAQKWIIKDVGNGYYNITSKCNGLCLDISGGKSSNGTNIQVYTENGTNAQQFKLEEVVQIDLLESEQTIEDGFYKINSGLNANKYLDISAGSKDNGANLQIWDEGYVDQQIFQIIYLESGYYKIEA